MTDRGAANPRTEEVLAPHMSVLAAFLVIGGFLVVAAVIVQFTHRTRNRRSRRFHHESGVYRPPR